MICSKCKKAAIPDVKYAGLSYCRQHFLELMEKRVRKNLRTRQLIDINKNYILIDDGSSEAKLTEYFLNKIFKGHLKLRISQKTQKNSSKTPAGIKILSSNLDEQALMFLDDFLKNKKTTNNSGAKGIIPLEVLMQKEIELICSFVNIPFKPKLSKDILENLENKYPGTKFSLFQSKMNLEKKQDAKSN